ADRADGGARDLGRDDRRRRARPGGRPMTAPDEYLGQVRRAMAGMEPKVRDDILLELRSHIAESSAANGGNVNASLGSIGSPEEVGRRYRELYGFGRLYKVLFGIIAFWLAIPSLSVLAGGRGDRSLYALCDVLLVRPAC